MESELAVQLEQRVTERLAQAQESNLRQAASLREHHRYMELTGCCLSPAAAGGVRARSRPSQIPLPSSNALAAVSLSVGELPSSSQGEPAVLGDFPFSPHRK